MSGCVWCGGAPRSDREPDLHFRVARALGQLSGLHAAAAWTHYANKDCRTVPRYDTDWSATGPLIERFGIALTPTSDRRMWVGALGRPYGYLETDALRGVCNWIVANVVDGKLQP